MILYTTKSVQSILQSQSQTTMSIVLLSVFLLVIFLSYKLLLNPKGSSKNLPPCPPTLPLIGNLHQLSSLVHRSLYTLSQKHGPVMLTHLGQVPTLIISSAEAAQEMFKYHDLAISTRPTSKAAQKLTYNARNISFAPYGEYWRQVKKLVVVHLLNSKRVQYFGALRAEEVTNMVRNITKACSNSSNSSRGSELQLSEILYEYANSVACHATAGKETKDGKISTKFRQLAAEGSDLLKGLQIDDLFPSLSWIGAVNGMDAKLEKIGKSFRDYISGILQEHAERKQLQDADSEDKDEDFVDMLLSLQRNEHEFALRDDDILAIMQDLIAAGTDTTFVFLEWAMTELVRNPKVMKKLQDEIREITNNKPMVEEEDINQMNYLKLVLKEVLRLHPPAPILLARETMSDISLQGYEIPAKTRVIFNVWAIGRDPKTWQNPEEFKPERFAENSIDFRGNHFELIPFGAGRRICPGIHFAVASNEIALANLLYKFNWELPQGTNAEDLDMTEAPGLTTPRKNPLRIVAIPVN